MKSFTSGNLARDTCNLLQHHSFCCSDVFLQDAFGQWCRDAPPRLLIIGPEGDFDMEELAQLTQHGAELVGLGSHRLRVETAALAMLSAAQLLM